GTATDPNGDPVTIAASNVPNGSIQQLSTMPAQALWSFTPTASQVGTIRVTFTGSDGVLSTSQTIAVTVIAAGSTPGSTAPTSSGTTSGGGATTPGSTASAAKAGGSSSAGGCELIASGDRSALVYLPWGLALLLVVLRRRAA